MAEQPSPMLPRPFRIDSVRKETADTFTLSLVPVGASLPLMFSPGQFNMLYAFGVGESAISISGNPSKSESFVHTIRAVGTVTNAIRSHRRGDVLGVRGPFGKPWPLAAAYGKDVVICAGGLGLAPLRPVIYSIIDEREKFGSVSIFYGLRSPDDMLFRHELEHWRGRFDLDVQVSVDHAPIGWRGAVGWITALIPWARFEPAKTVGFICGPEVMMRSTARELSRRGVSDERIFVSLERNMKCAVGFCGHCMFGPEFVCRDGPVFPYSRVKDLMLIREL